MDSNNRAKAIPGGRSSGIQSTALDPAVAKVLRSTYLLLAAQVLTF